MSNKLESIWAELVDVEYISQQPGIKYRFQNPKTPRADNDPSLNNQPWYHGSSFQSVDPNQKPKDKK